MNNELYCLPHGGHNSITTILHIFQGAIYCDENVLHRITRTIDLTIR